MNLDRETREHLIKETEEQVYLHRFFHSSDSKVFSLHEDYYLIRNGVVYAIQEHGKENALFPTGDKLISYMTCIHIGKYDEKSHESGKYKRKLGWFNVDDIRPMLKESYKDLK
ncbi:MAG: hypothetical protein AABY15_00345 [Nanoarchaeota archaeon]